MSGEYNYTGTLQGQQDDYDSESSDSSGSESYDPNAHSSKNQLTCEK